MGGMKPDGLTRSAGNALYGRTGVDFNAFVGEELMQGFRYVLIFPMRQAAGPFDDRHAAAETAHRLRELQSHVATAQNDEVLRDAVKLKSFNVCQRLGFLEAGDGIDGGAGPRADQEEIACLEGPAFRRRRDRPRSSWER